LIDLENNDILVICATVIAGALIFLTIASQSNSLVEVNGIIIVRTLGFGIIIFFSYAALQAISGKKDRALKHIRRGFLFIFFISLFLVVDGVASFYLNEQNQSSLPMINQSNMTMDK
jgi:hypothetical protein